jgi:hypothetical protein
VQQVDIDRFTTEAVELAVDIAQDGRGTVIAFGMLPAKVEIDAESDFRADVGWLRVAAGDLAENSLAAGLVVADRRVEKSHPTLQGALDERWPHGSVDARIAQTVRAHGHDRDAQTGATEGAITHAG